MRNASLYEQLGGEPAIDAAVELLYTKVLADGRINHYFDGVDMDQQSRMMKAYLTYAFGGPAIYTGSELRDAHRRLHLSEADFDAVMEDAGASMQELGVEDDLIEQAAARLMAVKPDVLNQS